MRMLFIIFITLSACGKSADKVEILHHKEIHQMDRQEVISAIQDCRTANLRSVIVHSRVKATGRSLPILVDVTCPPF